MNLELWNKIIAFDLDNPPSEYGFSIRLAKENLWTKEFTDQAILEYKKFMYLAATSGDMISPSEIIDTVWHQHLIFTQSYQDFCHILGKQIQHIPSTHNREEFKKFKQAKERTIKFYEKDFGKQPQNIWSYNKIFDSLNLEKAKLKTRTFILLGTFFFIGLTVPAYFLLKPIYLQINNPNFIIGFIVFALSILLTLEFYNKSKLKNIILDFDKSSFIYNLHPFELIYLKTQKISHVINGTVSELVDNGTIKINKNKTLELVKSNGEYNNFQHQVVYVLADLGTTYYPNLINNLTSKPIFSNIPNSMDAFRKYFNKSKKFGYLFYTNFSILTLLILLSFTRLVIGIFRDYPIGQILTLTIVLVIISIIFLKRLTEQISTKTIPDIYKYDILPTKEFKSNWQWTYFLVGTAVLSASFVPIARYVDKNNNIGGNCGTSCGSSCSSCGGCGGD